MFLTAHARARIDFSDEHLRPEVLRKSYAYYFRLQLLVLQKQIREQRTGLCPAFQIVEPWYKRQQLTQTGWRTL